MRRVANEHDASTVPLIDRIEIVHPNHPALVSHGCL
jgi:hypothetical protein